MVMSATDCERMPRVIAAFVVGQRAIVFIVLVRLVDGKRDITPLDSAQYFFSSLLHFPKIPLRRKGIIFHVSSVSLGSSSYST